MTTVESCVPTWDAYAAQHTEEIFRVAHNRLDESAGAYNKRLRIHLDNMIDTYFDSSDLTPTPVDWLGLGSLAILASGQLDENETVSTLCMKQGDYGPNNIARFGHSGLLLRLHDKVARLENLVSQGREAQNESLHDTYLDIVGYSVIGMMLLDGSFFFPLTSFD